MPLLSNMTSDDSATSGKAQTSHNDVHEAGPLENVAPSKALTSALDGSPFGRMDTSQRLFVVLSSLFVACLLLGDVIGGKAIPTFDLTLGPLAIGGPISVGIIPFPVTFLLTDVVNDFYGRKGASFLTWLGAAMATFAFVLLVTTSAIPAHPDTYFTQAEYQKIFGGSAQLFVASIVAFLVGQFLDIHVFQFWKRLTESKHLWLRATGSTVLSQLIDTITINAIFWRWTANKDWSWIGAKAGREYVLKLFVAILLTPVVYAVHGFIVRVLGIEPTAHEPHADERRTAIDGS
ncbi:MAG: queuosine precursor transporter [Polyangiaceae bacterium]